MFALGVCALELRFDMRPELVTALFLGLLGLVVTGLILAQAQLLAHLLGGVNLFVRERRLPVRLLERVQEQRRRGARTKLREARQQRAAVAFAARGVEHDIIQQARASDTAPYYEPQSNEVAIFEAAYRKRLPVYASTYLGDDQGGLPADHDAEEGQDDQRQLERDR